MSEILHQAVTEAYEVFHTGKPLARETANRLAGLSGDALLDLVSLAHKVRLRYADDARAIHACSIMNAKSGACGENCRFCAQSRYNSAAIDVYDLAGEASVLRQAAETLEQGVTHFGIVTSGYGYLKVTPEFRKILAMIDLLHRELPALNVCASFGVLAEETAAALAAHGIAHYNINIQVNPDRYGALIADTHTVEDRIATVRLLRKHLVSVCCGGIIGVGESMHDRLDMIYALGDLDVSVIPQRAGASRWNASCGKSCCRCCRHCQNLCDLPSGASSKDHQVRRWTGECHDGFSGSPDALRGERIPDRGLSDHPRQGGGD